MRLKERMDQIKQLEVVETPYEVKRIFGELELFGGQVNMRGDDCRDFVDMDEFREALKWLVEQCGGLIIWEESAKKGKKNETKTR